MSYNTRLTGRITIDPPLQYGDLRDSPWVKFQHPAPAGSSRPEWHAIRLIVVEAPVETEQGLLVTKTAALVGVLDDENRAGADEVLEDVRRLIAAFPGHTWHGKIRGEGEEAEDVWRVVVDGTHASVARPVIQWPDDETPGPCPFTHSHTRHWCGYVTCRES